MNGGSQPGPWRVYLELLRPHRARLLRIAVPLALLSLLYLPLVALTHRSIGAPGAIENGPRLAAHALGALCLLVVHAIATVFTKRAAIDTSRVVTEQVRTDLVEKTLALSRRHYTTLDPQHLRFLILVETERIDALNHLALTQVIPAVLSGLVLLAVLCVLTPSLFALLIVIVAVFALCTRRLRARLDADTRAYRSQLIRYTHDTAQLAQNLDLVHQQSMANTEFDTHVETITNTSSAAVRLWFRRTVYTETLNVMLYIGVVALLLVASYLFGQAALSVADLAAFAVVVALLASITRPIWRSYPQILNGREALSAISTFLLSAAGAARPAAGAGVEQVAGELSFNAVSFDYGGTPVLQNFDLSLNAGDCVVLAGPSGVGKTTLIDLAAGFYAPNSGAVCIDGRDYGELELASVRRHFGIVPQNDLVWPGSLKANILYGSPDASDADLDEACRIAGVSEMLADLPAGLDTPIGEDGVLLSGGQVQRLSIARALVRRPRVLLMDEPTSHLDETMGTRILTDIRNMEPRPTILMASHDPRCLALADRVIRLSHAKAGA